MPIADYKDTPRDALIEKLAYLMKLNYVCLFENKNIDKFDYADVATKVYDTRIMPSGDFSYTNIKRILDTNLYNQAEIDELTKELETEYQTHLQKLEDYKTKVCSNPMTSEQEFKYERFKFEAEHKRSSAGVKMSLEKIYIYETYQPDMFACKPRDYATMMESLAKVGNPRVTAYADWYANANTYEQNTKYSEKYDEYFESLEDLITLHEIDHGVIQVDGLYGEKNLY